MPNWLHNTLAYSVMIILLLIVASVPLTAALLWGFAWGALVAVVAFALLWWFGGYLGMAGGFEVVVFGGFALVVGLIIGTVLGVLT